ncbi:hypothetical protein FKG94_22300 [Exilibacterium tricleocarpae]|uniref:Roadblock/LAMTOR2 domain-containing protein n=1 Tax=Exilibacterium tricleocarpae TaxID=2591008 RepID=A0A545SY41_9GAMM|nr:roadblock/LC7 domain-containing protein [Exilibacterium tricleocarpae]TQV69887.1 hypothetical protein FKG94_22300 [Exilibacterium tricleocarpae]
MAEKKSRETLTRRIVSILKLLNTKSDDMEASALISRDGICIAADLRQGVNSDRLAAMCATLLGLADTAVKELERGALQQVLLYGSEGILLLIQVGKDHVLALEAKPSINVGMILLDARKTAKMLVSMVPRQR